jgi:dihydrofolate reductase
MIAAVARNRVIGGDNQLLWHLPEDMRHFRETTRGKPVIMGRKTWESLPDSFRPLPGRHNIVVSRNPNYTAAGATLAGSLQEAISKAGSGVEVFLIGGAELYRQALPLATRLYLTEIDQDFDGDAVFPEVSAQEWQETSRQEQQGSASPPFSFVVYQRR